MDKKMYVAPEMEEAKLDFEFYLDLINYSSGVDFTGEDAPDENEEP